MKTHSTPYQQLLSALLGLLYLFVVTPVQYWHQHSEKDAISVEQAYVCQYNTDSGYTEANCSICSHKYSGYQLEIAEPVFTTPFVLSLSFTIADLPAVDGVYATLCNKGPPTLA